MKTLFMSLLIFFKSKSHIFIILAILRRLAGPTSATPGQHSSEETWQRWRVIDDIASDLTGPGIGSRLPTLIAMSLTTTQAGFLSKYFKIKNQIFIFVIILAAKFHF